MDFNWLQEAFDTEIFTAFDTETTGLEPSLERVIEIGAIRFDKNGIIARYNVLINPQRPILAQVTKINNITDAMVKNEAPFSGIVSDFISFIGKSILIAHNAPFDLSFINAEFARLSQAELQNRCIDTIPFAKTEFPQAGKYSLQFLAQYFHIDVKNAHRAEDDARVCMEIFLKCLHTEAY